MNLKERELRIKYRYTKLSYVFDIYSEFELRVNSTEEEYKGLKTGEVRFDYATWERRLEFSHTQMKRAIKELVNEGYIIQTFKGKKGEGSKYFLTRFRDQNFDQNFDQNKTSNSKGSEGTRDQKRDQNFDHTSIYSNQDIKSNIYNVIFDFWNEKGIKKHRSLSIGIKQSIDKALKEYSVEEIKEAISNYATILHDETYYFSYVWGLDQFLVKTDKDRMKQLPQFLNDGSKWINYQNSKKQDNIIHLNNREFKRTPVKNNNDEMRKELEEEGMFF